MMVSDGESDGHSGQSAPEVRENPKGSLGLIIHRTHPACPGVKAVFQLVIGVQYSISIKCSIQ